MIPKVVESLIKIEASVFTRVLTEAKFQEEEGVNVFHDLHLFEFLQV